MSDAALVAAIRLARHLIGASTENRGAAFREASINEAWHVLDKALRAAETARLVAYVTRARENG